MGDVAQLRSLLMVQVVVQVELCIMNGSSTSVGEQVARIVWIPYRSDGLKRGVGPWQSLCSPTLIRCFRAGRFIAYSPSADSGLGLLVGGGLTVNL